MRGRSVLPVIGFVVGYKPVDRFTGYKSVWIRSKSMSVALNETGIGLLYLAPHIVQIKTGFLNVGVMYRAEKIFLFLSLSLPLLVAEPTRQT